MPQHLDTISPDQSPSKDPRDLDTVDQEDPQLPSPDPVVIHSQALLTPDGSPLTGPPPYQPPESASDVPLDWPAPLDQRDQITDTVLTESTDCVPTDQTSRRVPQTLSAPVARAVSLGPDPDQSESLVQLPEQTSAGSTIKNQNQDWSEASAETQTLDS